jgi:rubredoxin
MSITKRGKPDDGAVVHMRVPRGRREADYPACNNGGFHIRWSDLPREVTCPVCKLRVVRRISKDEYS